MDDDLMNALHPTTADDILVIGHHNPDTDAICSALAYAHFYQCTTGMHAIACHLDEVGPETAWLIDHLGLDTPRSITDVHLRVADVMEHAAPHLLPGDTLRRAAQLMREHELGALAVLDMKGHLAGTLARDQLADRYLYLLRLIREINRPIEALRQALEAEIIVRGTSEHIAGMVRVGTFSTDVGRSSLHPGEILIVEDDTELQHVALERGVICMILARSAPAPENVLAMARKRGTAILRTHHSSLSAAVLLEQSTPVESVMQRDAHAVTPDDLLGEAQQHLRQGRLSALPVVEADGRYVGLLLRRHLVPQRRRRVILTDHNHAGQAAAGVTESDILAIIDHHNLGGLQTLQPLVMHIEPVGCTCTLIAEMYQRAGVVPTHQIAGAMLGAILSDTVQFRSPTTTPRDRAAAAWLSAQSGEQIETLARSMFRARLPNPTPPPEWWVSRDRKVYTFGDTTIGIAQIELVDVEQVMPPVDALRRALAEATRREQLTTAFLLLTDILEQRSLLLAADETGERIAEQAFGGHVANGILALPGVMSRKSQVVPPLAGALVG